MSGEPPSSLPYARPEARPRRRRRGGLALYLGGPLLLLTLICTFVPEPARGPRINSNVVACASNLRQIGQALYLYANENHNLYPPTFDLLFSTQDLGTDVAICRGSNTQRPSTQPSAQWFNTSSDYVYLGAGLTGAAPASVILAHDKPGNHDDGVNVLFGDGGVQFCLTKDFPALPQKSAAARAAWEATTKPTSVAP